MELKPSTLVAAGVEDTSGLCNYCEDENAFFECKECASIYCVNCDDVLHVSATKQLHHRVALQTAIDGNIAGARPSPSPSPSPSGAMAHVGVLCAQCEEMESSVQCIECGKLTLCAECDDFLHLSPSKQAHIRVPVDTITPMGAGVAAGVAAGGAGAGAGVCEICEENVVSFGCVECGNGMCADCNEFLHMGDKAAHTRMPV